MTASPTLPSLLPAVLAALERAYIMEGAGRPPLPPLDLWANLLRAIGPAGTDPRSFPAFLRLSKRAVRTRLATAVRHGWVQQQKADRGEAIVSLTPRGAAVAARWQSLEQAAEARWAAEVGMESSATLRAALQALVAVLPLEHPHYPAGYGPADASVTGGNGDDWNPVPRANGDTVSALPISALVSQALVAFFMHYEEQSPVAFSLSRDVIRRIPPSGLPLRELGASPGVSALIRHGFVQVSGAGASQVASLTPRGLAVSSAYQARIRDIEQNWHQRFGEGRVTALVRALESVTIKQLPCV
jgi:hypothetical protein